ncbi:MAG: elongation factor P maturation arginine rhamnosyltransferase EarP [Burkholderiaceae bacterium]
MLQIDLFCQIVDNYGDAGISWRLASQLADELPASVTLWIDQPGILKKWQESRERLLACQPARQLGSLLVRDSAMLTSAPGTELASTFCAGDVCISLLAAELPEHVLDAITTRTTLWLRYEYLTAEAWTADCHTLPSPHPQRPLTQWFYCPGFTPDSGGLLRERGLAARRANFSVDDAHHWLSGQQLQGPANALHVCLFGYPDEPLRAFIRGLRKYDRPIHLILHEQLYRDLGEPASASGLTICCHPWLDQDNFDHLLWSCDLNLVRGEESWIRAHWAEQPFLWQPYRQDNDAHCDKLDAFLERLSGGGRHNGGQNQAKPEWFCAAASAITTLSQLISPPDATVCGASDATVCGASDATVADEVMANAVHTYLEQLPAIRNIHRNWTKKLLEQSPVTDRIGAFIADHLQ